MMEGVKSLVVGWMKKEKYDGCIKGIEDREGE